MLETLWLLSANSCLTAMIALTATTASTFVSIALSAFKLIKPQEPHQTKPFQVQLLEFIEFSFFLSCQTFIPQDEFQITLWRMVFILKSVKGMVNMEQPV
jgi:hypothetical protein